MNMAWKSERLLKVSGLSSLPLIGAHSYWQGLRDAFGRLPRFGAADPKRFIGANQPTAMVQFDKNGAPGRLTAFTGASGHAPLRPSPADANQPRRSMSRSGAGDSHPLRTYWQRMLESREAILCTARPQNGACVEWAMLPFSEDGESIDRAVILRDETQRPSADASWTTPHAATLAEFANRHQIGIVALARRGSVQFANAAATKMLSATDAFSFSYPGELIGRTAIATGLLQQNVPANDTRRAVIDDIVLRSEPYRAGLILSLRQLNVLPELNSVAHQVFGLRAAEARIATGIVHGKTLQKISDEAGITLNTARTQLKSAMGRMGVTRQQELVRLLCLVAAV